MDKDLNGLITEINQIRDEMKTVIEKADPNMIIHPGWSIRELLCHITAWEIVIDKALIAYKKGDTPYFLHEQDFDIFNDEAVDCRDDLSLDEVIQEWHDVRAALIKTIKKLKAADLDVEMVLPWGSERTVAELIEIAGEHEDEHLEDISKVMK